MVFGRPQLGLWKDQILKSGVEEKKIMTPMMKTEKELLLLKLTTVHSIIIFESNYERI